MSCVAFERYGEEFESCWERTADLYWDIVDSDEVNASSATCIEAVQDGVSNLAAEHNYKVSSYRFVRI